MSEPVTLAVRDPAMIPELHAWARRHNYQLDRVRPYGESGRSEAWDGTEFMHLAVEITSQDPHEDIVFWLEELADAVRPLNLADGRDSPFAWRETTDVQDPWYILRDDTAKIMDPYVIGIIEDVEEFEPDEDEDEDEVSPADLDVINRHRATLGMGPVDLSVGWSADELREMADSIRKTGRMQNEGRIRPLLPPRGR